MDTQEEEDEKRHPEPSYLDHCTVSFRVDGVVEGVVSPPEQDVLNNLLGFCHSSSVSANLAFLTEALSYTLVVATTAHGASVNTLVAGQISDIILAVERAESYPHALFLFLGFLSSQHVLIKLVVSRAADITHTCEFLSVLVELCVDHLTFQMKTQPSPTETELDTWSSAQTQSDHKDDIEPGEIPHLQAAGCGGGDTLGCVASSTHFLAAVRMAWVMLRRIQPMEREGKRGKKERKERDAD
jgi:hypothetical protein